MTFNFICAEHPDIGDLLGWRLESQPGFDPLGGMAVAHDCIEHFPNGSDSPHDELQALGSALWGRGQAGYWSDKYHPQPGYHLSADMPDIFRHIYRESMRMVVPPRTKPLEEMEDEIQRCLGEVAKNWVDEFERPLNLQEREYIQGWMRVGFRRADRRFRRMRVNPFELCESFRYIEQEADRHLKTALEGEKLRVKILPRFENVLVSKVYLEDEFNEA